MDAYQGIGRCGELPSPFLGGETNLCVWKRRALTNLSDLHSGLSISRTTEDSDNKSSQWKLREYWVELSSVDKLGEESREAKTALENHPCRVNLANSEVSPNIKATLEPGSSDAYVPEQGKITRSLSSSNLVK
ncbi:hypothetical protein AVEN_133813-1 [Araneus ventricosus]|uniref:Uncharacterized protein n=1 Tax=Araneus ventricosus TaxID=182803 RepID=A0A4Y2K220_ARAVE|nr:hypothetical protein AVEN_133813-1 [Araneus ventricosus]